MQLTAGGRVESALLSTVSAAALSGFTSFPVPMPLAANASLINGSNDDLLIPLHVQRVDDDHAGLGLPVQIDGKPVYLALDTGTQGVRVLKSVLPGSSYASARTVPPLSLENGAEGLGAAMMFPVGIAGATQTQDTAQAVETVRCQANARHCQAMNGYTGDFGWAFSGIFGVGAAQPNDSCCAQPLRALHGNIGQRYLVRSNFTKPFLLLSPSSSLTKEFTMVPMTGLKDGAAQWPRGCVAT